MYSMSTKTFFIFPPFLVADLGSVIFFASLVGLRRNNGQRRLEGKPPYALTLHSECTPSPQTTKLFAPMA